MHSLDRRGMEEVGAVLPDRVEPSSRSWRNRNRSTPDARRLRLHLHGVDTGQPKRRLGRIDREKHLEERVAAQVAHRLQLPYEQFERKLGVRGDIAHAGSGAFAEACGSSGTREIAADDDGARGERRSCRRGPSSDDRRPVRRSGGPRRPCNGGARHRRVQGAPRRSSLLRIGQAPRAWSVSPAGRGNRRLAPRRLAHRRTGPVRGQVECGGRILELARPVRELAGEQFAGRAANAATPRSRRTEHAAPEATRGDLRRMTRTAS